jgi:hypothetical protein
MPKNDNVTFRDTAFADPEWTSAGLNLCEPVGPSQKNNKGDVMLVQAMLRRLAQLRSPGFIGLGSMAEVPDVTGDLDAKTKRAIRKFQSTWSTSLLPGGVDGVVHPAAYQKADGSQRKVNVGSGPLMTITLLHLFLRANGEDYPTTLPQQFPALLPFITAGCG